MDTAQIDAEVLKNTVREIVRTEFPTELEIFDVSADQILREMETTGQAPEAVAAPHEFGEGLGEVLQYIPLIVAAYFALKRLIKDLLPSTSSEHQILSVENNFRSELEKNGVSKSKARDIASRYAGRILQAAKHKR